MTDYINKEELLNAIYIENLKEQNPNAESKSIITLIKEAPSIDAVEVVRCKDCKWYQSVYCTCSKFSFRNGDNYNEYCAAVESDGYCKWGEKEWMN